MEILDDIGKPNGTMAYTRYPEFDNLTGYCTHQSVREWVDRQGNKWRKTVTIINLGRPDRGTRLDPDKAMMPERLPATGIVGRDSYENAIATNRLNRWAKWRNLVVPYLEEHGPTQMVVLAAQAGVRNVTGLREMLTLDTERFVKLWKQPQVWGLVGQTFEGPESTEPPRLFVIRDVLLEHGPLTEYEIQKLAGVERSYLNKLLNGNMDDWFCVVDVVKRDNSRLPVRRWGVVGVHGRDD